MQTTVDRLEATFDITSTLLVQVKLALASGR
jgi:hypothetical protein